MQAVIGTTTGASYQIGLDDQQANAVTGKQIGDEVAGSLFGLDGYTLEITGGSDQEGFPMRESLSGTGRRSILVTNETGGHDLRDGERERTTVRGNTVSTQIEQLNLRVVEQGDEDVETLLHGDDAGDEA
jgi:small subunit ribosomal protein S6e